jgi:hypothetical protein
MLATPSDAEIQDIRMGTALFAWVDDGGPVAVLCCRFGSLPWMDAPHEPWKEKQADRGAPAGTAGSSLVLNVVLVDASTGIIQALRLLTWEPQFADAVRNTITRQLAIPRDDAAAGRALDALYQLDTAALATRAKARCTGGVRSDTDGGQAETVIDRYVAGVIPGTAYLRPLPPDLAAWYVYTQDGGHQIAVAVARHYQVGADPAGFVVPAPVKAVLRRGWSVQDGWIVCDLPYDPATGLISDPGDDEY